MPRRILFNCFFFGGDFLYLLMYVFAFAFRFIYDAFIYAFCFYKVVVRVLRWPKLRSSYAVMLFTGLRSFRHESFVFCFCFLFCFGGLFVFFNMSVSILFSCY